MWTLKPGKPKRTRACSARPSCPGRRENARCPAEARRYARGRTPCSQALMSRAMPRLVRIRENRPNRSTPRSARKAATRLGSEGYSSFQASARQTTDGWRAPAARMEVRVDVDVTKAGRASIRGSPPRSPASPAHDVAADSARRARRATACAVSFAPGRTPSPCGGAWSRRPLPDSGRAACRAGRPRELPAFRDLVGQPAFGERSSDRKSSARSAPRS